MACGMIIHRVAIGGSEGSWKCENATGTNCSGVFSCRFRAMKTPDLFDRRRYSSGGTTPANVNISVIRKSPGVADCNTGVQFGRVAR